ncbi:MAG: prepilin-type N-terminal cleavage/methylation domain-containing protein [Candidatus Omnitrophota bacterium]|nr:prepilin-type N-terminal cleavage/methylation domain-containing protein [Candidatus Omnitrophota bacterium]
MAGSKNGFTLIEILIVITILGILAAAIIPNFVGFDKEARVAATKSNLDTLRGRITLFRAKEGKYPESLDELLSTTYSDMGIQKSYLDKIPNEMVSSSSGSNEVIAIKSSDPLTGKGGWAYIKDRADIVINVISELNDSWKNNAGQKPSDW